MIDIITLTCPNCGGKLQIGQDLERFACSYCGNEHLVKRSGETISLTPVVDSLAKIETGVDKTASELAIRRLREDIAELNTKLKQTNQDRQIGYGAVLALIGFVLLAINIFSGSQGSPIWGLLGIIIGAIMLSNGLKAAKEEKNLAKVLKAKKTELEYHENIVNRQLK